MDSMSCFHIHLLSATDDFFTKTGLVVAEADSSC